MENKVTSEELGSVLKSYGFNLPIVDVVETPVSLTFELQIDANFRLKTLQFRLKDLSLALGRDFRVIAPYKKGHIGLEFSIKTPVLEFGSFLKQMDKEAPLSIPIGLSADGTCQSLDLTKAPHLLVAGSTGSGKSTFLGATIESLRRRNTPKDLRLILVDVKSLDFTAYSGDAFTYNPCQLNAIHDVITKAADAKKVFKTLVADMGNRLELLKKAGVKNIEDYNKKGNKIPYLVVIVDEFAELCSGEEKDEILDNIQRLSQLSRAAGIHIILATQKPTAAIVSTAIKVNFPCRIAFRLPARRDYMTVLDVCPPLMSYEPAGSAWVRIPEKGDIFHVQSPLSPDTIGLQEPQKNDAYAAISAYAEFKPSSGITEEWAWFIKQIFSENSRLFVFRNLVDAASGAYFLSSERDSSYFGFDSSQFEFVMEKSVKLGFAEKMPQGNYRLDIAKFLEYANSNIDSLLKWEETNSPAGFNPGEGWYEEMRRVREDRMGAEDARASDLSEEA